MAGSFWTSLLGRLTADRRGSSLSGATGPAAGRGSSEGPELGWRLTGEPQVLTRVVTVAPQTLAVVFEADHPPRIALPGDRLTPSVLPSRRALQILVVNTAPVYLDVTVDALTTLDQRTVSRCVVRIAVQIDDGDRYGRLLDLVREVGAALEVHLLNRVRNEASAELHAAIRMNRLADLHRVSVQQVLADRWLPRTFAGGVLRRRDFAVLSLVSPPAGRTHEEPAERAPEPELPARASPSGRMELTMDARLHRVWRSVSESVLLGIAAASVEGASTVVAVAEREPGAYEHSRLREEFGRLLAGERVRLVVTAASSYDDLVHAWVKEIDDSPGRLMAVESGTSGTDGPDGADAVLRVSLDPELTAAEGPSGVLQVGTASDREALRRLVPHARIEFVPGWSG